MAQMGEWPLDSGQDVNSTPRYVNGFQVLWSQWDFMFSLHHVYSVAGADGSAQDGRVSVARLVMSPQHMKALLKVVQEQVGNYEKRFGVIPLLEETPGAS